MNVIKVLAFAAFLAGSNPAYAQPLTELPAAKLNTLTYEQAVDEGMKFNLDLQAAKYNIPLAEADELTAGLFNNPSVLLDAVLQPFGRNWNQSNTGGPRQYDAALSYPFDLSGKRRAAKKSAHAASDIAHLAFQDAMRQKLREIRLAYIDAMTFRQQLSLAREKEDILQNLVRVIQNRIGGSVRLPLMRLRSQLARDQAVLDRRQREITLRSARIALSILLGRQYRSEFDIVTPLRDFKIPEPPPMESLVSQALKDRPDLQALRLAVEKAGLDRNLAAAQRWDNFVVSAGVTTQDAVSANPDIFGSQALPRSNSWDASITIPWPLFNRNQGNIHRAELSGDQLKKQIASSELAISQEIAGIYDQLVLNRQLIVDYENRQLPNARKVRDEQQKLVGMGSNSLLDYFDALGAYTGAVSAYYDAVGEYRRNAARLNSACAKEILP